jgi:hypothetical protein
MKLMFDVDITCRVLPEAGKVTESSTSPNPLVHISLTYQQQMFKNPYDLGMLENLRYFFNIGPRYK